jgi:hypothetical protein
MGGKTEFELPTGAKVTLIYGAQHPGRGTGFLQGVRTGIYNDSSVEALANRNMLWVYQRDLAALVGQELPSFDAIVSPPSCRQDADPYRSAIAEGQKAMDLTPFFTRKNKYKVSLFTNLRASMCQCRAMTVHAQYIPSPSLHRPQLRACSVVP